MVQSYRGQSSLSVVLLGRRGQPFFEVSRSSWMVFIFYVGYAHVFIETYGWGKPRSCLDKCTGVGRTRVGGHETRPKPKPNVDYYLVTYYYYFYYYYY